MRYASSCSRVMLLSKSPCTAATSNPDRRPSNSTSCSNKGSASLQLPPSFPTQWHSVTAGAVKCAQAGTSGV